MAPLVYVTGTCFVFLTLQIVNEMAQLYDEVMLVKSASSVCDQKGLQTVELILRRLTALEQERRKPERFEANCKESQQLLALLEKFASKCYSPDIQKFASIFLYSLQATVEKICTRKAVPKSSSGYLPNSPPLHNYTCLQKLINESASLRPEERTTFACCQSAKIISCAEDYLRKTPCTRRRSPIMLDFVRSLLANLNRIACSENELEPFTPQSCSGFSTPSPQVLSSSLSSLQTVSGKKRFSNEMIVMIDFHNLINV